MSQQVPVSPEGPEEGPERVLRQPSEWINSFFFSELEGEGPPPVSATISKQRRCTGGSANDVRTKELAENMEGRPSWEGQEHAGFSKSLERVYYKCTGTVKRNDHVIRGTPAPIRAAAPLRL